ncbi:helix-turn-helix transcriptional regulator [Reichenbachiella versicolor]|uniref:helix-turn-helix transcriptional regulator n=1 Tax=Reichenbachiella versicolor TaxID=1821036 RepID=UPI000D6E7C43|nr:YafY family protein [Reichenbachiella versicolor]
MNRIDRLTAMILRLQAHRHVTALEFSEHFEISERTVFRDIKALGEAGIPIGFEKDKGYYIVDGYYVPPIMFSKEEAGAILLAGKLLERQGDKSLVDQYDQALTKVRAVLKTSSQDYLHELDKHIEIIPSSRSLNSVEDKFLMDIKNAVVSKRVLKFEYFANYSGTYSERTVEPLGICHYSNHWHLIAHCQMRDAVRDFRTDRITKLITLDEEFDPSIREDFKDHIFELTPAQELEEVKLLFTTQVARYLSDQKYYYGMIEECNTDEGIEMTFMVGEMEYFARWLLMYTSSVRVLESDRLKRLMQELTESLAEQYLVKENF